MSNILNKIDSHEKREYVFDGKPKEENPKKKRKKIHIFMMSGDLS